MYGDSRKTILATVTYFSFPESLKISQGIQIYHQQKITSSQESASSKGIQ
jgi:hypothetical protein